MNSDAESAMYKSALSVLLPLAVILWFGLIAANYFGAFNGTDPVMVIIRPTIKPLIGIYGFTIAFSAVAWKFQFSTGTDTKVPLSVTAFAIFKGFIAFGAVMAISCFLNK